MLALDVFDKAQFVVDAYGNRQAVLIDYRLWEELLALLEDQEDAREIQRLREAGEETIPWEQAKAELRAEGMNVMSARLATRSEKKLYEEG